MGSRPIVLAVLGPEPPNTVGLLSLSKKSLMSWRGYSIADPGKTITFRFPFKKFHT